MKPEARQAKVREAFGHLSALHRTALTRAVPTIPQTLKLLKVMERQLNSAKTYEQLTNLLHAVEALKLLYQDVTKVKQEAEITILVGNRRIAEEMEKVPKAKGGGQLGKGGFRIDAKSIAGRAATKVPKDRRSRIKKLLKKTTDGIKKLARHLQKEGKDATVGAIVHELKNDDLKEKRKEYAARAERGAPMASLHELIKAETKFPVIYADAPWTFKTYSDRGKERSPERHYRVMSLDQIKALPIQKLAAKNCVLLMWGVWPEVQGCLDVIKAWGFEYKTVGFVWVKQNRNGKGLFTGMGYWTRSNTEFCLLATIGKPQRTAKDIHQVIMSPVGKHSEKPEEARKRIEKLFIGPYLELFARGGTKGWTSWGDEAEVVKEAAE